MHLRHSARTPLLLAALASLAAASAARAQSLPTFLRSTLDDQRHGFQIYGASVGSGYYTATVPGLGAQPIGPNNVVLGADIANTMTASLGYRWLKPTSNFEIIYTPSYFGNVRNSEFNTWNHNVSITGARPLHLGQRLTLSFNLQGGVTNYRQFLFSPGALDSFALDPNNFQDLTAATLTGGMTNNQIAGMLTGSSAIASPAQFLFYGDRVLTANLTTTLSYSYSPRLSINFSVGAIRYQHLNDNVAGNDTQAGFVLPQTTSGVADLNVAYVLSPRTQIGVDVGTNRNFSRFQEGFSSTAMLYVRRNMKQRWFVEGNAGGAMVHTIGGPKDSATQPQYLVGGSLGIRTYAHVLVASAQHTISNSFGIVYTASDTNLTWIWRPGARAWFLATTGSYERLRDPATSSVYSWRGSTSAGRRIGSHFSASLAFVAMAYSGRFSALPYRFSQRGVQLGLSWTPSGGLW